MRVSNLMNFDEPSNVEGTYTNEKNEDLCKLISLGFDVEISKQALETFDMNYEAAKTWLTENQLGGNVKVKKKPKQRKQYE